MEKNRAEKDVYANGGYEYGGYGDGEYGRLADGGFVMVSRSILESAVWKDAADAALYFYCVLNASYKGGAKLRPGQFYGSAVGIGLDLGWSRNCVAKHMERLQRMGLIQSERKPGGTVYTVAGWREISRGLPGPASRMAKKRISEEDRRDADRGPSGEAARTERTAQDMSSAQIMCTARDEGREVQNMSGSAQIVCMDCTQNEHVQINKKETRETRAREFETWWERYPRHSGKSRARQMWMTMQTPAAELNAALENAKRSADWLSDNGRFIPAAENWLDGAWEDYAARDEEKGETAWKEY